ncbi:lytic transglycosylase domain-containing protein [Neisseria zalophi]|uniref:Lytic transglycosylase domain-containing protein n=1 Tax=Neisseria zalophi TaxID=640030 RepID=A0A5J6PTY3_9NEIS|nr:lytic transglycosylase domain-containing protein [Neisseria zalophi]QEY25774.1 lytic transglycosylase domain-containing protein [Neisseria zalophi]
MKKYLYVLLFASTVASAAPYSQYKALVEKHAAAQGLDANLVWAVIARESGGNRYALSKKNARGLMQVIPPTAARMGVNPKHLYSPEHNIIAGTRYLKFLSNRYNGNLDLILAGYNAGEGAVDKYKGIPPYRETQNYVRLVRKRYAQLSGNSNYAPSSSDATAIRASYQVKPVVKNRLVSDEHKMSEVTTKKFAEWDVFQEF